MIKKVTNIPNNPNMAPFLKPKSVISVMMITFLFLNRCFYVLRAQWRSIVTDKRKDR